MAVTVNGKKFSKATVAKWQREINSGKRSALDIEENVLGTNGRGKTVTRLIAKQLQDA